MHYRSMSVLCGDVAEVGEPVFDWFEILLGLKLSSLFLVCDITQPTVKDGVRADFLFCFFQ